MILTIVGANFEGANIGQNKNVTITLNKTGANGSKSSVTLKKGESVSSNTVIATGLSEASGYENLVVTVTMAGTGDVSGWYSNGVVTIPSETPITGNITIKAIASKIATGGGDVVDPEPEKPGTGGGSGSGSGTTGNGQWLSVLVTGDENAHTEFMNYTDTIGALTNVPCAYVKPEIQKHLSGKRVTKVACYVLGSDSSISFYTNDYSQSGTTSGDGHWQKVFTLTDPSSKVAAGTKTKKEYNVNFTIEEGDTLAFYDMEKMNSPANKPDLMSYVLPVNYTMNPGGTYGTALPNFIAFDFYVE